MKRQLSSFYLILFTVFSVCHVNNQSYAQWYKNPEITVPLVILVITLIVCIPLSIWEQQRETANRKKEIELMAEKLNAANRPQGAIRMPIAAGYSPSPTS
jgi:hypothetical protein